MTVQYQDDPNYLSIVTSQPSLTRNHHYAGLATWTSWMKTSPQRSYVHYKLQAIDSFTLDPSTFDVAFVEPLLPLDVDDESLAWNWAPLNVRPTSGRNEQPCESASYEIPPRSSAYNSQNFARANSWSNTDADLNLSWTNLPSGSAITETIELPANNDRVATSPLGSDDAQTVQMPTGWPAEDLNRSSSLGPCQMPDEYLRCALSLADTLLSSTSAGAEDQGREPESHQSPASDRAWCRTSCLPSIIAEADLSKSSRKRQSETGDQQQAPMKKSRHVPTRKMARHSVIEKRYRTKLNDELERLRDKVPSLRLKPKRTEDYAYREGKEKLDRPEASSKFDKATVVSKAVEYITYIELCNKRLVQEHLALIDRLSAIETMASADQ